jgi:hypothetical protein
MNNDDIHRLSGAYVVNAVDDTQRDLFEAHLADCSSAGTRWRTCAPPPASWPR